MNPFCEPIINLYGTTPEATPVPPWGSAPYPQLPVVISPEVEIAVPGPERFDQGNCVGMPCACVCNASPDRASTGGAQRRASRVRATLHGAAYATAE